MEDKLTQALIELSGYALEGARNAIEQIELFLENAAEDDPIREVFENRVRELKEMVAVVEDNLP